MSDKTLMRFKDMLLILLSLASVFGIGFRIYGKPMQLESRIMSLEKNGEKYTPMVNKHETQIAVIGEQYASILKSLDKIEKKIDLKK